MLKKISESFINTLFPGKCLVCSDLYNKPAGNKQKNSGNSSIWSDDTAEELFIQLFSPYVCDSCLNRFLPISPPWCIRCGHKFNESPASENHLCGRCIKSPLKIRYIRSAGLYETSLLHLIRAYKFRKKLQLTLPFSSLLNEIFKKAYPWSGSPGPEYPDLIIPVPLHKKRIRQRKFNQVWLILKDWGKEATGSDFINLPDIKNDILIRQKITLPQTGLDRKSRRTNIRGAFSVAQPDAVKGKNILLVDDVYTTGATAEECASVLLRAEAAAVDLLTLAKTEVD